MGEARTAPARVDTRVIPSLDGLRAISIGLVLFAHAEGTRGFPGWIPHSIADHGLLGVQIFFVISGFLITRLLLDEQARTGGISLRRFYARRTLRIFPPFFLFLAAIAIGTHAGWFDVPPRTFLFALTYTMNYMRELPWMPGHLWSLSVEEQFYLVWPLTMKLAGARRAFWIAGALAAGIPVLGLSLYLIDQTRAISANFSLMASSIAAGCILAGGLPWLRLKKGLVQFFSSPLGDLAGPLIWLLDFGRNHPRIHFALIDPALNILICYAIVRYTEFPRGVMGWFLNHPWVSFIGRLSYSLYLWQQIFMDRFGTTPAQALPLNLGISLGCALASYYSVEKPLAGLRKRLRAVASAAPARPG